MVDKVSTENKKPVDVSDTTLIQSMGEPEKKNPKLVLLFAAIILLGIGSGYLLAKNGGAIPGAPKEGSGASVSKGTIVGSNDTKTFKDTAEGKLEEGGIDSEGQFHLVRPGGDSQNVYLTSSIVDLSQFVGRKVKVWGETNTAKKAGWLMDVGKVEVLE